jgi:uncharacterized protein (DUF952 family)
MNRNVFIYHLVESHWWQLQADKDYYESQTLMAEKFIHASAFNQLPDTARRYFKNLNTVMVLKIEIAKLEHQLIWEKSEKLDQVFPHIYGPINKTAIVEVLTYSQFINAIK